jgi:YHS domain-containing protein
MEFRKIFANGVALLLMVPLLHAQQVQEISGDDRNVSKNGIAVGGYDPVSYFLSQKAEKGKKEFSIKTGSAVYFFATQQHLDLFKTDPLRYEPQYGGWCAYAMGESGNKVEVDPETFKVIDGKLYLFYNRYFNNTLKSWNRDETRLKNNADANWKKYNHQHGVTIN